MRVAHSNANAHSHTHTAEELKVKLGRVEKRTLKNAKPLGLSCGGGDCGYLPVMKRVYRAVIVDDCERKQVQRRGVHHSNAGQLK